MTCPRIDGLRQCLALYPALDTIQIPRGEAALWIEQWVSCAKQLSHWDVLLEYSRATENHELAIDCLWRCSDWPGLKETLLTKAQVRPWPHEWPLLLPYTCGSPCNAHYLLTMSAVLFCGVLLVVCRSSPPPSRSTCAQLSPLLFAPRPQVEENSGVLMTKAYLALQEGDVSTAELRSNQAMQAALARWWQLPDVGCAPQQLLLQSFQQVSECRRNSCHAAMQA